MHNTLCTHAMLWVLGSWQLAPRSWHPAAGTPQLAGDSLASSTHVLNPELLPHFAPLQ